MTPLMRTGEKTFASETKTNVGGPAVRLKNGWRFTILKNGRAILLFDILLIMVLRFVRHAIKKLKEAKRTMNYFSLNY